MKHFTLLHIWIQILITTALIALIGIAIGFIGGKTIAMKEKTIIEYFAILWSLLNFGITTLCLMMYKILRKSYILLFALGGIIKGVWGITIPGLDVEIIRIVNGIILPVTGGIILFFGYYLWIVYEAKKKEA